MMSSPIRSCTRSTIPRSLAEYNAILKEVNCLTNDNVKYLLFISKIIYINYNGRNSPELTATLAHVYYKSAQVSMLANEPTGDTRALLERSMHHINFALNCKPKSPFILATWAEIFNFNRSRMASFSNEFSLLPLIASRINESLSYCSSYEKNPLAIYILGAITYDIASSSWFEKKVIRFKNGSRFLLKYTLTDAKEYFTSIAFRWNPYYRATCIWLAKIEFKLGNKEKSLEWADKAASMKQFDPEDALMEPELSYLLKKLFKFRTKAFVSIPKND